MAQGNPPDPSGHDGLATEFDLREGILVLVAWWREILCLSVVGAILGTGWYALTLDYEAAADVVVLRARTGVVFDDERFTTLPDQGRQPAAELLAGRDTLFGLASSGAVALAVSERLNQEAADFEWEPASLLESVEAELVGARGARNTRGQTSAMVRIRARAGSPENAALIANAWAEAYVHLVNTLYAPNSAEQLASITGELGGAQEAYVAAQRDLEAFVSANEARRVEQEIQARVAVLEGYFDSAVKSLNENRTTRRRLSRLLSAVQSLRDQIRAGGAAGVPSNELAIRLLKVEAYVTAAKVMPPLTLPPSSSVSGLNSILELNSVLELKEISDSPGLILDVGNFDETRVDASTQGADLEALEQALRNWLAALDQSIAAQSADLLRAGFYSAFSLAVSGVSSMPAPVDGSGAVRSIEEHYEDIRSLEARLEALVKREEQLTSQRDRLFTALDVLRNKEAEFRLAAAVSQPELRLASPAVQPVALRAFGRHLLPPALVSGTAGILIGVAVVFIGNLMGVGPCLAPNRPGALDTASLP